MVIDTSAIVAILNGEQDGPSLRQRLFMHPDRRISAGNYLELSMVVARSNVPGDLVQLDRFLDEGAIEIMAVESTDALIAREAFLRYGKGRHPAGLNLGDCFAYALAKRLNEPLLFKGDDFAQTDVLRA